MPFEVRTEKANWDSWKTNSSSEFDNLANRILYMRYKIMFAKYNEQIKQCMFGSLFKNLY